MCDNIDCKCTYCNNDNYDRYIGDHMREVLDNINRFLIEPILKQGVENEESFYNMIMYKAQEELLQNKLETLNVVHQQFQ